MARRSDHTREELHQLALDAAEDIVRSKGLPALTARNVANTIGYSPGTLYNVFNNLDDLILHLNGRTIDRLYEHLSLIDVTGSPQTDIRALLDGYLAFMPDNRPVWSVLFDHNRSGEASLPDWYRRKIDRLLGLLERILSPLMANNRQDAAGHHARVLWAGLHGIHSLETSGRLHVVGDKGLREMAHSLVETYLLGLRADRDKNDAG